MTQPSDFIPGTHIPVDPRNRTKNHARVEITVWMEVPDTTLAISEFKDASDMARKFEAGFMADVADIFKNVNTIPVIGEMNFHVESRVSR